MLHNAPMTGRLSHNQISSAGHCLLTRKVGMFSIVMLILLPGV
jgi:hypothetical protein